MQYPVKVGQIVIALTSVPVVEDYRTFSQSAAKYILGVVVTLAAELQVWG